MRCEAFVCCVWEMVGGSLNDYGEEEGSSTGKERANEKRKRKIAEVKVRVVRWRPFRERVQRFTAYVKTER